jgi:hypothetical protein
MAPTVVVLSRWVIIGLQLLENHASWDVHCLAGHLESLVGNPCRYQGWDYSNVLILMVNAQSL